MKSEESFLRVKAKLEVMRYYDSLASAYDELYGKEQDVKYQNVLKAIHNLRGRVIDLGCGTGSFLSIIARLPATECIGVDISYGMLRVALKKLHDFPNVNLLLADAERLPLRNEVFDFVISITVIQDTYSGHDLMKEGIRVLRKGGRAIITVLARALSKAGLSELLKDRRIMLVKSWRAGKDVAYLILKR